jgi:hypothetical protein
MKIPFGQDNQLKMNIHPEGVLGARFKDTRIMMFPNWKMPNSEEICNIIEFHRLQKEDKPALCINKKARVFKKKALTISIVGLTEEGMAALHLVLSRHYHTRHSIKNFTMLDPEEANPIANTLYMYWGNEVEFDEIFEKLVTSDRKELIEYLAPVENDMIQLIVKLLKR